MRLTARFILGLCLVLGQAKSHAHEALVNKAVVEKVSSQSLLLRFEVDPAKLMHRGLEARVSFETFLSRYAAMPANQFQQAVDQLQTRVAKELSVVGADGAQLVVSRWTWPSSRQWQEALRVQLSLYKARPDDQGHMPAIAVQATAVGLRELSQVQLNLPKMMQPIFVQASATDSFWLTDKAPAAVVSFEL